MGAITKSMIECAYDVGKRVYLGDIRKIDGVAEVSRRTDMSESSANFYIMVLVDMLDGKEYHRTINATATEYYLEHIALDYGRKRQKIAAKAVDMHAKYYASLNHGHQVQIEELAKKYM